MGQNIESISCFLVNDRKSMYLSINELLHSIVKTEHTEREGVCDKEIVHCTSKHIHVYLLDIPRQPTCMKLGTRELYQPIQSCHVVCLGISNKSVAVPRQDSICGLMLSCLGTAT